MKKLEENARKLAALFADPEPGLATWNETVQRVARDVRHDVDRLEGRPSSDCPSRPAPEEDVAKAVESMRPIFDGFIRPYLRPGNFAFDKALDGMARAAIGKAKA